MKLAGLPYNTTGKDLEDIVIKVGGKDCFIPKNPKNYKNLRYAFIHFDNEEKWKNAANKKILYTKGPIKNQELIFVDTAEKLCNMCARPNHMVKNCPMKNLKKSTNRNQNRYDVDSHWNNMNKTWAQVAKKGNQKNSNYNNNNRNDRHILHKDNPYKNGQIEKEYKESREKKSREVKDIAKEYEEKFKKLIEERSKDLEIIHKAYQDIKAKVSSLDKEINQIKENIKNKQSGRESQSAKVETKRSKKNDSSDSEGEKTDEKKQIMKVQEHQAVIYDSLNNMGELIEKFINTSKQLNFNENSQMADEDEGASFEADEEDLEEF
jgi:chromosome segregation ATPase